MKSRVEKQIRDIVDKETLAWDTQDVSLLISIFHPDMVWPFPPNADAHDPMDWIFVMGRYDKKRWMALWQNLFDTHRLVHNRREISKIVLSEQKDGAFAVVDIDTLWINDRGDEDHWKGTVCKIYSKCEDGWKMIMQTGALNYPRK